jgi:hypothetical protein
VNITLDLEWTVYNAHGKDLETADPSIRALLVTQNCSWGAVRVDSDPVSNVMTGKGNNFYIIVEPGQTCRYYQHPSVRHFHLQQLSK